MEKEFIKIGYISKAFGFKGELKFALNVASLSKDFPAFVWIYIDGKPVPFCIEKVAVQNDLNGILKLEDINEEATAMSLKNKSIYCEDAIYDTYFEREDSLEQLIGYTVIDKEKGDIGEVVQIIENTLQPNLVLAFQEKEILIPYTDAIITHIDDKKKTIHINAPDGLIELYLNT